MIESTELKKINNNKYLLILNFENTDITEGIYLTRKELYLFYTKIR